MLLHCHNVAQGLRERSGAETEACQKKCQPENSEVTASHHLSPCMQ